VLLDVQERFGPRRSLKDGEPLHLECPADEGPDIAVVIDNNSTELA